MLECEQQWDQTATAGAENEIESNFLKRGWGGVELIKNEEWFVYGTRGLLGEKDEDTKLLWILFALTLGYKLYFFSPALNQHCSYNRFTYSFAF